MWVIMIYYGCGVFYARKKVIKNGCNIFYNKVLCTWNIYYLHYVFMFVLSFIYFNKFTLNHIEISIKNMKEKTLDITGKLNSLKDFEKSQLSTLLAFIIFHIVHDTIFCHNFLSIYKYSKSQWSLLRCSQTSWKEYVWKWASCEQKGIIPHFPCFQDFLNFHVLYIFESLKINTFWCSLKKNWFEKFWKAKHPENGNAKLCMGFFLQKNTRNNILCANKLF